MRKALRESGAGVQEMADYLGVTRNTVGTWINGHIEPSTQTVRLWAMRCGVSYGWLKTGEHDSHPSTGGYLPEIAQIVDLHPAYLQRPAA
jgi:transcriptional regulator with XRE-family HTH domain